MLVQENIWQLKLKDCFVATILHHVIGCEAINVWRHQNIKADAAYCNVLFILRTLSLTIWDHSFLVFSWKLGFLCDIVRFAWIGCLLLHWVLLDWLEIFFGSHRQALFADYLFPLSKKVILFLYALLINGPNSYLYWSKEVLSFMLQGMREIELYIWFFPARVTIKSYLI